MEYFDFDRASHGSYAQDDDAASDAIEVDDVDAVADIHSLRQEQPLEFPCDPSEQIVSNEQVENPMDFFTVESKYPMFRAQDPCDFCRTMGFDCFVAKRGVMQNGCTCCISLYRECSFTHAKRPGKFLDTLHTVSENVDIPTGGLTGKRALKSLTGATMDDMDLSRKGAARFPREAVRVLKAWLYEHRQHPYPTEREKDELKERTGLKRTQISNWLANARRRGKVRSIARSNSPVPGAIDIPRQHRDMSLMTPLERWKHSPPEHEAAATSDIIRALENTPFDSAKQPSNHVRSFSRRTGSSNESSHTNSNMMPASSGSSLDTSRSSISDLSFASAFSHRSSLGSMDRKDRRRRRKPSAAVNTFNQQKARSARIFQCTFCADSFPTKYDWQRHEKSLHLALDKWTCSPQGGVVNMHGSNRCVFCLVVDPDNDHLESHNYSFCQEKTLQERTFYRKDHLNQHLKLMHNVKYDQSMDKWRSSTTEIKSRCGFCGTAFMTWKERVDHLASHFKNGADMSKWQGDWGFEPFVHSLVENAMPPYLIGQERKTLDPFKTSLKTLYAPAQRGDAHSEPILTVPDDENCYFRLQQQLTAFVHRHVSLGDIPTDQMIQDEARRIIYGSDDPWNQTCADNAVWLSVLKRDAGIEPVPNSDHIQFDNLGMQPPFAAHGGLRLPPAESNPLARFSVCHRTLADPSVPSSGFQSPALRTGQSSAAPSMPGSAAGSYGASSGAISAKRTPGLASDWESVYSTRTSSSSVPAQGSVDPLVQMGFEPEFLQRLNEDYGDLDEEMDGLTFDSAVGGDTDPPDWTDKMSNARDRQPGSNLMSAPIAIPNAKGSNISVSEPFLPDQVPFTDRQHFESEGI